jgi:hypothetical protein
MPTIPKLQKPILPTFASMFLLRHYLPSIVPAVLVVGVVVILLFSFIKQKQTTDVDWQTVADLCEEILQV